MMKKYLPTIVVVGVVLLFLWLRTRTENYEKREVIKYIRSTNKLNPFMVWGMFKKLTTDENIQKKSLRLAKENNAQELIKLANALP